MDDIEILIEAAHEHGQQSEPDMEVGDLQELARFMWSQLSLKSREHVLKHFHGHFQCWLTNRCPHGIKLGECEACDVAGDLAYDAAREDARKNG